MATQQSTYIDGDTGGAMVVYVTVPSQDVADALASGLVEAKLAACVNIVPGGYLLVGVSGFTSVSCDCLYRSCVRGNVMTAHHTRSSPPPISPTPTPGLTSVYYWEGKVNKDSELLLMIKTQQGKMPQLTSWVKEKHPYDECEVIGVPITGGSRSYIQWVLDSTAG